MHLVGAILIEQNDECSVATAGRPRRQPIKPPFDLESHRYQTVHAADWIASLVGRLGAFRKEPGAWARSGRNRTPSRLPLPQVLLRYLPDHHRSIRLRHAQHPFQRYPNPPSLSNKKGHFNFAERGHYGFGLTRPPAPA